MVGVTKGLITTIECHHHLQKTGWTPGSTSPRLRLSPGGAWLLQEQIQGYREAIAPLLNFKILIFPSDLNFENFPNENKPEQVSK